MLLLAAALAVPGSTAWAAMEGADDRPHRLKLPETLGHPEITERIEIERGKAILIETEFPVKRIAVGDPKIADFVAINEREFEVVAKDVGETSILVWGAKRLEGILDIRVGTIQPHIVRELGRLLGHENIIIDVAGSSIILRGSVPNLQAYEQAGMLARAFLSKGQSAVAGEDVQPPPEVINLLQVGGKHQVMIDVVIAELSKTFRRALGVNLAGRLTDGSKRAATFQTLLANLTSNPELLVAPVSPAGLSTLTESISLAGSYFKLGGGNLRIFLEAVESSQLGKVLAKPTLVARSGEQADFLVGGEVPIPLVTNIGATTGSQFTILFKKFGVNVEFTPTVLDSDRIHLQISPEVSEPDFTLGVRVLGQSVPGFRTRRVTTSVELGDGETFMLGGLLREDVAGETENIPFLQDIPLIGQFFRTRVIERAQTELVIMVTPHLVTPIAAGSRIELPTDHYIEPTNWEFYWNGWLEGKPRPSEAEAEATDEAGEAESAEASVEKAPAMTKQPAGGGFFGDYGYRMESPRPTGEAE